MSLVMIFEANLIGIQYINNNQNKTHWIYIFGEYASMSSKLQRIENSPNLSRYSLEKCDVFDDKVEQVQNLIFIVTL